MQGCILPSRIHANLDKVCRNFLWGSTNEKKKLHMVGWNKVTMPKNKGGLGLHATKERNTTLAAKLCWRMKEESDELRSRVLKFKYNRRSVSSKAPKSRLWKAILHGAAICKQGSKWSIGNNNQLSFWEDKRLNLGTIRECIEGLLQKGEAELWVCDIHISGMWELHKVSFILSPVLSQSIKATPIRTALASKDLLSLSASPRREFDPKSAYLIACGDNASEGCF